MIFVICGTQKFQFNRLISAIDKQVGNEQIKDTVFAQIGGGDYEPKNFPYVRFMDDEEFKKKILEADLIITHSGTGSIINSLKSEKKVIVVPRLKKYGEHVSDHQMEIADMFEKAGLVKTCLHTETLYSVINEMKMFSPAKYNSNTKNVLETIDRDLRQIEESISSKKRK